MMLMTESCKNMFVFLSRCMWYARSCYFPFQNSLKNTTWCTVSIYYPICYQWLMWAWWEVSIAHWHLPLNDFWLSAIHFSSIGEYFQKGNTLCLKKIPKKFSLLSSRVTLLLKPLVIHFCPFNFFFRFFQIILHCKLLESEIIWKNL